MTFTRFLHVFILPLHSLFCIAVHPVYGFSQFQNGDIIFQNLSSAFGSGVQTSSGSEWAHVGIVVEKSPAEFVVLEATYPGGVKWTEMNRFLRNCRHRFAVTRLRNFSPDKIETMIERAASHLGKPYDKYFVIDEMNAVYCSELLYDALNFAAGTQMVKSRPMDFTNAWEYWQTWFGSHPIPQGEPGIAPGHIFELPEAELIWHYADQPRRLSPKALKRQQKLFQYLHQSNTE
jgi:hypothetical protein